MTRRGFVALRPAARDQAGRMISVLQTVDPELLNALTADPLGALAAHPDLQLRLVPETHTAAGCTVAGGYRHTETPPALLVTASLSRRRQAFTALHEYGHHLQQTDFDLGVNLLEHDSGEDLEEAACQVFASRVLLPDTLISRLTPQRGPDATTVAAYYDNGRASRAACCVRAAEQLVGGGAVVLYQPDGTVDATASTGLIPPARGSNQASTPLLTRALSRPGETVAHDKTFIAYSTGTSGPLYGHATWIDGYLVAVLKEDNASWKAFAPPRTERGTYTGPSRYLTCDRCLQDYTRTADVCPTCETPRCPRRHCSCPSSARERACPSCGLTLDKARFAAFDDPKSPCRDCG